MQPRSPPTHHGRTDKYLFFLHLLKAEEMVQLCKALFKKKKNVSDQKTDPDLTLNGFVCQLLTSSRDVSGKADWKIEKAVGEQEFIQRRLGKYPSKQHQQESL